MVDNPGSVLGMGLFDNEGFGGGAAVHFFIFFFFNGSRWAEVEEVNEDDDKGKNVESALSAAIATFCFLRGIVVVAEVVFVLRLLVVVAVSINIVFPLGSLGMENDDDAVMWCV